MALLRKIRARATYANVMATLALFVALGGGSFAVAALSGSEKRVVKKIASKEVKQRVKSFSFRTSADKTVNNLVRAGGLTIDVSCTGTTLTATAETSVNDSSIYTASFDTANSVDPVDNQDNDADFDKPDPRDLLNENGGLQVGHTSYAAGTRGPAVDVLWSSDTTPNFDCLFVGHVVVG